MHKLGIFREFQEVNFVVLLRVIVKTRLKSNIYNDKLILYKIHP